MASFYAGSRMLEPVGELFGLPIDQVNFLACQFTGLGLAYVFRVCLSPNQVTATARHVFEICVGVTLIFFCFGHQLIYILGQALTCFFMMQMMPSRIMPKAVFIGSMTLLCICHIWRQMYDYGGYTMDITGPLMINTQRMTSLAWSLVDGQEKEPEKELTKLQKKYAIKRCPSMLQFLSYTFNFHGAMVGPFCFYVDYVDFIEGKNLIQPAVANGNKHGDVPAIKSEGQNECPSPRNLVAKNLFAFGICAIIVIFVIPLFPITYLSDPVYLESNIINKIFYMIVCTTVVRPKYYLAWTLAEALSHNAGFGFYYDDKGQRKWDLVDNAHIKEVELCTSLKVLLDHWNITTTSWLRHIVYERIKTGNTYAVFAVSCVWHGFYPGYYLTFLTSAFFVPASRLVRRNVRPWFQTSPEKIQAYEVITFTVTRIAVAYMTFPFVYLEFAPCWELYKRVYFILHIISVVIIAFFMLRPKSPNKTKAA